MDPVRVLETFALLGIPVGLVAGLLLGLVARHETGWGGYASLPRRAARLGHVAAVMLPALGGLYGLLLAAHGFAAPLAQAGAGCWVAGGIGLPVALLVVARRPRALLLLPVPALTVVAGALLLALSALGGAS